MIKYLLGLDTETTGIDAATAELIQIGAIAHDLESDERQIVFNSLARPSCRFIDPGATQVHGHTAESLKDYPSPEMVAWSLQRVVEALQEEGCVVMVTYNGEAYDLPILRRYDATRTLTHHIDMYRVAQRHPELWGEDVKMGSVYKNIMGHEMQNAHDAMADVTGLLQILEVFLDRKDLTIEGLMEWMATPIILPVMPFGKFMGTPFNRVPKAYLRWMQENIKDMNPDMRLTVQRYL